MRLLTTLLPLLVIGAAVAEPQWHNSTDGRRYLIESQQKYNWFKANHECSRRNLQLVEIQSQSKNEALVKLLKNVFGQSVGLWLGANDEFNEKIDTARPFHWSSSGERLAFSNWYTGEPNNEQGKEHCVHTFPSDPDFKWNDVFCDYEYGYICEEQHAYKKYRKAMSERRQRVLQTLKKFYEKYQEEEKNAVEKVHSARDLMVKKNNAIQAFLEDIHNKMSHDFNHGVKLHNREVNNFATDTNQMIRELKEEMEGATEKSYENFSRQFNEVQQKVRNVLEDTDL